MSKSKPELKLVEDTGSQLQDEDLSIELPPQQSEMPFAVVEGEPMTQLPRDLYIPPDALQVFLTAFEGPLDLLLYLIRKQNLDILNIPIAEITRQYMKYIEVMAEMQLELAGEYLLMAAMLAEIKSRMLLPRPAAAEGQEEEDPRAELVRRLQEYERFKKAAEDIDRLARLERDTMPASAELEERKVVARPPDVTLKEMLDAFRDVLSRAEKFAHHHISRERLSQRERMSEILVRLQTVAFFEFAQLFKVEEGRMGVTVTFIAILELMKEGLIEIVQAEAYAPIHVRTAQRHLKVVQGGTAAETADAENVAALSQPELAGENDLPDEFADEPVADDAAIAVQAAVADVAAASSIAADSVETDASAADAGFVDAAVSEALASTESAVDTIATEEAAAIEEMAVIEQPAVFEEPVAEAESVVDEVAAADEDAAIESTLEAVEYAEAVAESTAEIVPLSSDEVAAENTGEVPDLGSEAVGAAATVTEGVFVEAADAATADAAVEAAASDAVEEHVADTHVVEEHTVEEHAVPEHVVEVDEQPAATPVDAVAADEAIEAAQAQVVEEHVVEEHEVEEHVVPEHVIEEQAVPEPNTEESASLAAFGAEVDVAAEPAVDPVTEVDAVAEPVAVVATESEAAEISDEAVASDDLPATDVVAEDAQPVEVAAEDASVLETIEVAAENVQPMAAVEVVAEDAQPLETIEVAVEDAAAVETTSVVVEDVAQSVAIDATETFEQTDEPPSELDNEQPGELSVDDDTVTGSSSEADNSDAEPSR